MRLSVRLFVAIEVHPFPGQQMTAKIMMKSTTEIAAAFPKY